MTHSDNITSAERWFSIIAGVALTWAAVHRRAPAARIAAATTGVFFLARGASSYCAVKAALRGNSSLGEGLKEQWNRMRATHSGGPSEAIDTVQGLHLAELQELHSAEAQLCRLLAELPARLKDTHLAGQLEAYAIDVNSRRADLARALRDRGSSPRQHSHQAMRALLLETSKVAAGSAPSLRDAAVLSSLQRVLHFKISGYGTVAAYAAWLGRADEAARLAQYAEQDRRFDAALCETAASLLNARTPTATDRTALGA